ncbi:DUF6538 domain-containing protein, partial [Cupriavidus basilensis]|uniref:DUF6538 domain-containing protein n=1 Tax=Cupriavidus basilensis TaxID=68895 RepID=UPI0023E87259
MKHPYLATRKSSRNFYFRRAVPESLRAVLPREIWISLQTPSRELALACLPDAARAFEQKLTTARQQLDDRPPDLYQPLAHCGPPVKLTPELIERVAERYFVHALASEAEQRLGITDDELTERETLVATAREQTRRARARADATYLAELAELALDIVTAEHLYVRPDSELFEQLVAALHKKDIAVLDEELARLRG